MMCFDGLVFNIYNYIMAQLHVLELSIGRVHYSHKLNWRCAAKFVATTRKKTLVLCEAYRHRSPVREAGPNGLPCSGMLKETGQKLPC